jgi:hypothetical protein
VSELLNTLREAWEGISPAPTASVAVQKLL